MRHLARRCYRARYWLAAGCAAILLAGCAQLKYYMQAAQGQYALWSDARPIEDWLGDPSTDPELKARLEKALLIRKFAVKELGLPDNASYKNYAALSRPFVLWNVVATPELSLRPIQWCFPIAGCVSYRGYYSKDDASAYADELRKEGNDVQVGGDDGERAFLQRGRNEFGLQVERHGEELPPALEFGQPVGLALGGALRERQAARHRKDAAVVHRLHVDAGATVLRDRDEPLVPQVSPGRGRREVVVDHLAHASPLLEIIPPAPRHRTAQSPARATSTRQS